MRKANLFFSLHFGHNSYSGFYNVTSYMTESETSITKSNIFFRPHHN